MTSSGALAGITVVDFTRHMAGPYGTVILSDYGAEVVKVESTPVGDPSRTTGTAFVDGVSGLFLQWNRGKRSLAIDLRQPDGLTAVHKLIASADVLVENYRPGVAADIGIGYEAMRELNPRLIYCSVSAFGQDGPLRDYPGTDPVVQAISGVMALTGEADGPPVLVGLPIADYAGALTVVQGVLLALLARERTGCGQWVDIPMMGAVAFGLTTRLASYWVGGEEPRRGGSAHSVVAPYQLYSASDGEFVAGAWAEDAWPRFCRAIERPDLVDDPRFATNTDRVRNRAALNEILDAIFATARVAEWEERFHQASALFGEVCSVSRVMDHPQMKALGLVQTVEHSTLGTIPQLASPIGLSETPRRLDRPPPLLGEHSVEVLSDLGYDESAISDLRRRGIVRTPEDR